MVEPMVALSTKRMSSRAMRERRPKGIEKRARVMKAVVELSRAEVRALGTMTKKALMKPSTSGKGTGREAEEGRDVKKVIMKVIRGTWIWAMKGMSTLPRVVLAARIRLLKAAKRVERMRVSPKLRG